MLNHDDSNMAAQSICFAADMAKTAWQETAWEHQRPSVVFKPMLSKDGNAWCALLGADLMNGVSGFGSTPAEAMYAFDQAWHKNSGEHVIAKETDDAR